MTLNDRSRESRVGIELQSTCHQFSRLPSEIQIEILRFAATTIQKPRAIYSKLDHPNAFKCHISSDSPPPPGMPQLDIQWLAELACVELHIGRAARCYWLPDNSMPEEEVICVVLDILRMNMGLATDRKSVV